MRLEDLKKLHQRKYREQYGCFLVEGEHLVLELQRAASQNAQLKGCELYVTRSRQQWQSQFVTHLISESQMARISETQEPQGIVARVPLLRPAAPREGERSTYLYQIQDPGNLGTILRTLAWFGKVRCLLSPGSVDTYNAKVVRASAGAIFHVPVESEVELGALGARFDRIACLDTTGESISSPEFRRFDCYLFGNEARGLPRAELASLNAKTFAITGRSPVESLNLAAAVNICTYELNR